ncbi:MAG: glycosyltransferase [Patescibacteria group bacterium]|nr:glycosyltransferase [Patescibacteria group bacterium]
MFSVVIPTKDEEDHIEKLLLSIKKQTLQPDEIIVADKSTDKTPQIAKKFGAKIVQGTDNHRVGIGRNNGARASRSQYIVFIDADSELRSKRFFSRFVGTFIKKDLDIATCYYTPDKKNLTNIIVFSGMNAFKKWADVTKNVIAEGAGCVIMKRDVFAALNGFNEEMKVGEDADIIKRATKMKFRFAVIPILIRTSTRRYDNRSTIKVLLGAAGIGVVTFFGYKWFRKNLHKFEDMYWKDGKKKSQST